MISFKKLFCTYVLIWRLYFKKFNRKSTNYLILFAITNRDYNWSIIRKYIVNKTIFFHSTSYAEVFIVMLSLFFVVKQLKYLLMNLNA